MFIGGILKERMNRFNFNPQMLANETFLDVDYILGILNDKIDSDDIDEIDLKFISNILYCEPEYFLSNEARKQDIIYSSLNRGKDDFKSNLAKGRIQQFTNDFLFLRNLLSEVKG